MAKVLLFGRNGLLGSAICRLYPDVVGLSRTDCDVSNPKDVLDVLGVHKPEYVINCAGLVPRSGADAMSMLQVNARFPRILADYSLIAGYKVIQISTDCVFDGKRGKYYEGDYESPDSVYGMSKLLGELTKYHLTLRTSFVGWPDPNGRGLLAWLNNSLADKPGYINHWWSGLTTSVLANWIMQNLNLTGKHHLHGERITKYELLKTVNEVYGWGKNVYPEEAATRIDRSLFTAHCNFPVPLIDFRTMVEDMRRRLGD